MNRHDFQKLARALHDGYADIHELEQKAGFNKAIRVVIAACSELNPDFDAVKFAVSVYNRAASTRTHRP